MWPLERPKPTRKLNVAAARSCVEDKELPPGRLACLAEYSRTLSLKGSLRIIRSTAFDAPRVIFATADYAITNIERLGKFWIKLFRAELPAMLSR